MRFWTLSSVGCVSDLGEGATFWFTLPFYRPEATAIAALLAAAEPDYLAVVPTEQPILLVEDDPNNCELLLQMLNTLGYAADFVSNGQEALEQWAVLDYSAILMDCQMPVMDGFQATRAIRAREAEEQRRYTPIVGITARTLSGDREQCLAAGMDDYLSKPVQLEVLAATLRRWLELAASG